MAKRQANTTSWTNPYTSEDWRHLQDAQKRLNDLLPIMDKAENCGIECQTFREVARDLLERLTAIQREFMTPPPPGCQSGCGR